MEWVKRLFALAGSLAIMLGLVGGARMSTSDPGSTRFTTILVSYTEYEWWLIDWGSNIILCRLFIDHEGLPTVEEVADACGSKLALLWQNTPPCDATNGCNGLYVHLVSTQAKQREVIIELPTATAWVSLEGCDPIPPENLCAVIPTLVLTGEEPLPDEWITAVQGTYDGAPFFCSGAICKLPLQATPIQGSTIEFWADSSYGDSSEHYTARVRVIDTGVSQAPGGSGWYVDIISSQWTGPPLTSCASIWEAFPPIGAPPIWLTTPERLELMASQKPYFYLAGRLIAQGIVDASGCPSNGQLPNGYANTCGLELARPLVDEWQNQFDQRIIEVANETGIPAQLMKNLFAQESQFWPGVFRVPYEFGLGQITDHGADVVLLWDPAFFSQFCPLVLSTEACEGGYLSLGEPESAILRGALALQAKSDCPECPMGIDLTNVYFSMTLFANTLRANCAQVSRTIYTATNQMAGQVSTYEDLWRFTIANYHAGPGCISYAIHQAWQNTGYLNWVEVSTRLTEPCQGVVPYVEKITR
jgi:hypothetical protein